MGLNKSTGNMYEFITHTWNTVKGECYHDCSYCYMKRWGKLNPVRFDEKELKTNLGKNNYIFVGSSCDLFAKNIPDEWINKTLNHMGKYVNYYLLQTKNPARLLNFIDNEILRNNCSVCTTIESNKDLLDYKRNSPDVFTRAISMNKISQVIPTYVTIEPIMDFDMDIMIQLIRDCNPSQVNIGADSGRNNLPEPTKEKVIQLIEKLSEFTKIHKKTNLNRLI